MPDLLARAPGGAAQQAPVRHVTPRKPGASSTPRGRSSSSRARAGVVTRKLARAADDGYRNPLVPGLRATADAERLAIALTDAAARLEPPGPYPLLADEPDLEQATWLAFLFALAPELQDVLAEAHPPWDEADVAALPEAKARTAAAYRAWVERAGSQQAAFTGEESWSPSAASAASSSGSRCPASTAPPATTC